MKKGYIEMNSQREALIFRIGDTVIREVLKYWIAVTFVTLSILVVMNQAIAFQTSLPDTDVQIQMDSVFKPITKGIKKDGYTGPALEGNNIAWDKIDDRRKLTKCFVLTNFPVTPTSPNF